MTALTHVILAAHSGKEQVQDSETITLELDLILGSDVSTPIAIQALESIGSPPLACPEKIVLVPDHCIPAASALHSENIQLLYSFSKKNKIQHAIGMKDSSEIGVEHALLPEQGFIYPGQVVIGADSHTCTYGAFGAFATGVGSTDLAAAMVLGKTWFQVPPLMYLEYQGEKPAYITGKDIILATLGKLGTDGALGKAVEFYGSAITNLPMEERMTMCNMAVELGAVSGLIAPDTLTWEWLAKRHIFPDPHKEYNTNYTSIKPHTLFDISSLKPQLACPSSPGNVCDVKAKENVHLDQVFIGSCTNGSLHDLRQAAQILKGRKKAGHIRLYVAPATPTIYKEATKEGLIDIFVDAGAQMLPPACTVCFGHIGCLGRNEACLSTSNRNFKGRMGHSEAQIYLASPYIAAASAIAGSIALPEGI